MDAGVFLDGFDTIYGNMKTIFATGMLISKLKSWWTRVRNMGQSRTRIKGRTRYIVSLRGGGMGMMMGLVMAAALMSCQSTRPGGDDDAPPELSLPAGFSYDHLHSPSAADQGTWVALAFDDQGRLYASDQHGALYRIDLGDAPPGKRSNIRVDSLDLRIGKANGLLWAFDGLYVVVNSHEEGLGGHNSGIYRLTDTDDDDDDELDHIETLMTMEGGGEHGPHSIMLSPDGEQLYFIAGNHTDLPETYTQLHPGEWQEDQLLPSFVDPRGHANDRMAPGGWVARMNPDGSDLEIFSSGYRNAYDMAFNKEGELFVFDADMEWDMGMPWYRPIRVCHATSASEFGWRTGTGKWPAYYPDSLPCVVDIGQGSPTGVMMGIGAAFPERYQQGMFVFDWSFGTIYLVELEPDGSSYKGTFEEFLSGVPLPVTDGVWGPDGAMYFATGGRNLKSHLYRVYYEGDESTEPISVTSPASPLRLLRQQLEMYHSKEDPQAIETAWPHLNHPDRFIRYAARIAIESQPVRDWWKRAIEEPDPIRRIQAVIALARSSDELHRYTAIQSLLKTDYAALSEEEQLDMLRAVGLVFIRMGEPGNYLKRRIANQLWPHYPSDSFALNKELSQVLAFLDARGYVGKTLTLLENASSERYEVPILSEELTARHNRYGKDIETMKSNMPSATEIAYAFSLSNVERGWTMDQRERYFQWFYDAMARSGGRSYVGFIDQIRRRALENVPGADREALADLVVEFNQSAVDFASLPQPAGPGQNWSQRQVRELFDEEELVLPRNYERGKMMYAAALCEACHTMQGVGGSVGPDLSQIGTRFGRGDIIEAIISPSDALTDQYAATVFTKTDGSTVIGRVLEQDEETVTINQNPFDLSQTTTLQKAEIESEKESPASIMPAGLINRLNADEVIDLVAYLEANGDPDHELFTQSELSEEE